MISFHQEMAPKGVAAFCEIPRADGVKATYRLRPTDDINRAFDFELTDWFDADLDAAIDLQA